MKIFITIHLLCFIAIIVFLHYMTKKHEFMAWIRPHLNDPVQWIIPFLTASAIIPIAPLLIFMTKKYHKKVSLQSEKYSKIYLSRYITNRSEIVIYKMFKDIYSPYMEDQKRYDYQGIIIKETESVIEHRKLDNPEETFNRLLTDLAQQVNEEPKQD